MKENEDKVTCPTMRRERGNEEGGEEERGRGNREEVINEEKEGREEG